MFLKLSFQEQDIFIMNMLVFEGVLLCELCVFSMAVSCITEWLTWNGRHVCKNALEYEHAFIVLFLNTEYFIWWNCWLFGNLLSLRSFWAYSFGLNLSLLFLCFTANSSSFWCNFVTQSKWAQKNQSGIGSLLMSVLPIIFSCMNC